jgi:cysteine-rich repeat protein
MRSPGIALVIALVALAASASGQVRIGSFRVNDGPGWLTSPPTYSCIEACAHLFGGSAQGWSCSTSDTAIDNQAFVSGWGTDQYCTTPVAEDFKAGDAVSNCGTVGCYYSAFVGDHCEAGEALNHCWLPTCGNGFTNPNEECDDGNDDDTDCCSNTCQAADAAVSCSDGDVCNGAEVCNGSGHCEAPAFACDAAGKASLAIDAAKDKAAFRWQRASIAIAALGDPTADTQHTLCVSDAEGTVLALETPAGPLWKATGKPGAETRFVYKDKAGANDGVRSLALKAQTAARRRSRSRPRRGAPRARAGHRPHGTRHRSTAELGRSVLGGQLRGGRSQEERRVAGEGDVDGRPAVATRASQRCPGWARASAACSHARAGASSAGSTAARSASSFSRASFAL